MSKKQFKAALRLVREGQLEQAVELLLKISDPGFINRRLRHHKAQPENQEAALQLEEAYRLSRAPSSKASLAATSALFNAPLAPGTVEAAPSQQITFQDPVPFLRWASAEWNGLPELRFDELNFTDIWPLVALACLLFPERPERPPVNLQGTSPAARFAHAVGLSKIAGREMPTNVEADRTVPLTRVRNRKEIEPTAERMASLVVRGEENHDIRLAVRYVLVELLRNVVQHSDDPLGAVAAAQIMGPSQRRSKPMIQIAVADAGIGIPRHLRRSHPHLVDYRQALERALLPHISGTFEEGLSGSFENAGLGLYMISELARQTRGSLLIATTGASLVLQQDSAGKSMTPRFLDPDGIGFPGTLVAFEIPSDAVQNYQETMQAILRKAEERTPKRSSGRWLKFSSGPEGAHRVGVFQVHEDTLAAAALSEEVIRPQIIQKKPIELDFAGLDLCTQSWLHALLFEPVRLAWALRVPIYIREAKPAVVEGLRFLESYALAG